MFTHEEIVEMIVEEIEQVSLACSSRAKPHIEDDEDIFVVEALERWHDRSVAQTMSERHYQLEKQADLILQSAA